MADTTRNIKIYMNGKEIRNNIETIAKEYKTARRELGKLTVGSKEYNKKAAEVKKLKGVLTGHNKQIAGLDKPWKNAWNSVKGYVGIGLSIGSVTSAVRFLSRRSSELAEVQSKVNLYFSETDENLGKVANKALSLSKVWKKDYNEVLEASNSLTKQLGGNAETNLRLIEKGFKKGADANGEFLQKLKEYSTQFKAAGFTAEQTIALISQEVKSGIYSDKGSDTIKEGTIRLREMTKATREAIDGIGLSSAQIEKDLRSGSKTYFEVMQEVSAQLGTLEKQSPEVGTAIADIFGGAGEDAGLDFLLTLQDIDLEMNNLEETATVYQKAQRGVTSEWNNLINSVIQGAGPVSAVFAKMLNYVQDMLKSIRHLNMEAEDVALEATFEQAEENVRKFKEQLNKTNEEVIAANKRNIDSWNEYLVGLEKGSEQYKELSAAIEDLEKKNEKLAEKSGELTNAEKVEAYNQKIKETQHIIADQQKALDELRSKYATRDGAQKPIKKEDRENIKRYTGQIARMRNEIKLYGQEVENLQNKVKEEPIVPGGSQGNKQDEAKALKEKERLAAKAKRIEEKLAEDIKKITEDLALAKLEGQEKEIQAVENKYNRLLAKAKEGSEQEKELLRLKEQEIDQVKADYAEKEAERREEAHKQITEATLTEKELALEQTREKYEGLIELAEEYDIATLELKEAFKEAMAEIEESDLEETDPLGMTDQDWDKLHGRFDMAMDGLNQLGNIRSLQHQIATQEENKELAEFKKKQKKKKKALKEQLDAEVISKEEYDKKVAELDKETDKREQETATQQAEREKKLALYQATLDFASGVMNIWSKYAWNPVVAALLTGGLAVTYGMQRKLINQQTVPSYDVGEREIKEDHLAMVHKGERIFTAQTVSDPVTGPLLEYAMQRQEGRNPRSPRVNTSKVQGGGATVINNYYTSDSQNDGKAMLFELQAIREHLSDPRNRQAVISNDIQEDFDEEQALLSELSNT